LKIGYNYHPATQGIDYWRIWDFHEIESDIARMASEGCEVVRFFIYWRDFEPREGQFDEEMFTRLKQFVHTINDYGMVCIPSIMTIWMNGQLFDIPWRNNRNLWKDPSIISAQRRYIEKVSSELGRYSNVMAYDLGDEMLYADWREALLLKSEDAENWLIQMVAALRTGDPSAKVLMAHDYTIGFGMHSFQLEVLSRHLDFIAIHGFPLWSPLTIESNDSYKASMFVPFLVKYASAFGSPLLDEFGLYAASESLREHYIHASGTSCLLHGAQGIIGWCWSDIRSNSKPYFDHVYEKSVGYYDSNRTPKPSAKALKKCMTEVVPLLEGTPEASEVAIYISQINRTISSHGTRDPRHTTLFYASMLLMRLHVPFELATEDFERYKMIIIPGNDCLNNDEIELLSSFIQQGGVVLYTPGSCLSGSGMESLFGNTLADFSLRGKENWEFTFDSRRYVVHWRNFKSEHVPIIEACDSKVLAYYEERSVPAFTVKSIGAGKAYYLNAPIELILDEPFLLDQEQFRWIYHYVLSEAGIKPYATCSCPEVEVHTRHYEDCDRCILINHSPYKQSGILTLRNGLKINFDLEKKMVSIININRKRISVEQSF